MIQPLLFQVEIKVRQYVNGTPAKIALGSEMSSISFHAWIDRDPR
jgi:hypothetical protein